MPFLNGCLKEFRIGESREVNLPNLCTFNRSLPVLSGILYDNLEQDVRKEICKLVSILGLYRDDVFVGINEAEET